MVKENEYYNKAKLICKDLYRHTNRKELVKQYSWSIPDSDILNRIKDFAENRIVEIGCGTGYWLSLLAKLNIHVEAFDNPKTRKEYGHSVSYVDIKNGSYSVLKKAKYKTYTLLLSWPPYNNNFAYRTLRNFRGDSLVYIGESRYGCTGNHRFFNLLEKEWEKLDIIKPLQWFGIEDYVFLYLRKKG